MSRTEYTHDEWLEEFYRRAGGRDWDHMKTVRFTCPACKTTYSVEDCFDALREHDAHTARALALNDAPQYCIHRLREDGECDWASFGLFRGPVTVVMSSHGDSHVFDFAEEGGPCRA